MGIKDKLKKLVTDRGGKKEHLLILRALGDRVQQNVNTNYPMVKVTLKESDALKWLDSKYDLTNPLPIKPHGFLQASFDDEGLLDWGAWHVEVPYSLPGSGIDVTAYGQLQNMPEPPRQAEESHTVSVRLKLDSKKDTPSRREWMQALAKEKADWEAARKEDREARASSSAQAGFEKECQELRKQVDELVDANASYANATQRALADQEENQDFREAATGLNVKEAEAIKFTVRRDIDGKEEPPKDYFRNMAKALEKLATSLPEEVLDFVDNEDEEDTDTDTDTDADQELDLQPGDRFSWVDRHGYTQSTTVDHVRADGAIVAKCKPVHVFTPCDLEYYKVRKLPPTEDDQ